MPTGSAGRRAQSGFTYLWLLFTMAAGGAVMATLGPAWSHAAQRERERESIFRGQQIAEAIGSWQRATAQLGLPPNAGPQDLQDLLEDARGGKFVRHLRRVYVDPLTGEPDWQLVRDGSGTIVAVRSRSQRLAMISHDLPAGEAGSRPRVDAREFRPRRADSPRAPQQPAGVPAPAQGQPITP